MKRPRKAIILAAGLGTRMLPLSDETPKAVMPLWGKPMLLHSLELLSRWGVRDVLINLHHLPAQVMDCVTRNPVPGLRVSFSFEQAILGTGGALKHAAWFLDDDPFWLINSDVAADVSASALLKDFNPEKHLAMLWLQDETGPRTVTANNGLLNSFHASRPGEPGTFTFCGIHLLSPRILKFIPVGFSSIITAYELAMRSGHRIGAATPQRFFWADTGTPDSYLDAHRQTRQRHKLGQRGGKLFDPSCEKAVRVLRRSGTTIKGFASIAINATIASKCRIEDSVIHDKAVLKPGSSIREAIVGKNTTVSGSANHIILPADRVRNLWIDTALRELNIPFADATVQVLPPRGSARTFYRVRHQRRSFIVINYSPERKENLLYSPHTAFLSELGVPVPAMILDLPELNTCVVEDIGDVSMLDHLKGKNQSDITACYRKVIGALPLLHLRGCAEARKKKIKLSPSFTPSLYRWEHALFRDCFLTRSNLRPHTIQKIMIDLAIAARALTKEPRALLHRDLQSSNVMIRRNKAVFIDFQGMRLGPAVYDLASLLCDPYMSLSPATQDKLLAEYADITGRDIEKLSKVFWYAATQRLVQALGAYGRLSDLPGMEHFSIHIDSGLAMLHRALSHLDDDLSHLRQFVCYSLDERREQ